MFLSVRRPAHASTAGAGGPPKRRPWSPSKRLLTRRYAHGICNAFQEMIGARLTPALSFQTDESSSVLSAVSLGHEYEYMIGKVGLEEHFAIPETLQDSAGF